MKDILKKCSDCELEAYEISDLSLFIKDARLFLGYRNLCKECHKGRQLIHRYGMSLLEYDSILKEQGYSCAICYSTVESSKGRFHVDHNHTTGEVRGLLCSSCNMGLGKLGDNVEVLTQAINYLKERGSYGTKRDKEVS